MHLKMLAFVYMCQSALVSTYQNRYIEKMDRVFLEAARKIDISKSLDDVWSLFVSTINKYGLDNALYMSVADQQPLKPLILSTLPGNWPLEEFKDPEFNEPFLTYCCATYEISKVGIEFIEDHSEYIDPGSEAYVSKYSEFGWRAGLGIPCSLVGTGRHGGLIIGSGLNRFSFERKILPLAAALQSFSLILHRRIEAIHFGNVTGSQRRALSAREQQTMSLISMGLRPKQIAHELNVSEASIRLYLKNAKAKLGVETKEEAIAVFVHQDKQPTF